MSRRRELFIRTSVQTNAGTAVNLASMVAQPGELWEPTFIGLYNNSGESVTADLAIFRTSDTLVVGGPQTVTNGTGYSTNTAPMLMPQEAVGFVVTGTADKGPVWLVIHGWIHYLNESPEGPGPDVAA